MSYRIARPLHVQVDTGGAVLVWAPAQRRHVRITVDELALLTAFGEGAEVDAAAAACGFEVGEGTAAAVAQLVELGLLDDGRAGTDLVEYFERHGAAWHEEAYRDGPFWFARGRMRMDAALRVLLPRLPGPATIVELGCGAGALAAALAERGHRVVGVDRSPSMLAEARGDVRFVQADALTYQPDTAVDVVIALGLVTYVDEDGLYAAMARMLAPGGIALISVPNRLSALWQPGPAMRRSAGELAALLDELEAHVAPVPDAAALALIDALGEAARALEARRDEIARGGAPPGSPDDDPNAAHRRTPREITAIAGRHGLTPEAWAGTSTPASSTLARALDGRIVAALAAPLAALTAHPASLGWSDEILAILRRT